MTVTITNAAPKTNFLGINDKSTVALSLAPIPVPDHCPLVCLYTQKGRSDKPYIVSGDAFTAEFGATSIDLTSKYVTHQTVLASLINSNANAFYVQRIVPSDAPKAASLRVSLDLLTTQVNEYQRNADGSLATDPTTGDPISTGTKISGFQAMWVMEMVPLDTDGNDTFGAGTQGIGTQTDSTTSTTSVRYPIFDIKVSSQGDWGNNTGFRMWAPTLTTGGGIDTTILTNDLVYPLRMAFVSRTSSTATPTIDLTTSGSAYVDFCLKPNTVDTSAGNQLYGGDVIVQGYQSLNAADGTPDTVSPFDKIYFYDAQIAAVLALVYAAEYPVKGDFSDFTGATGESYLFNLLTGVSSQNVPYHSYVVVSNTTPVRFSNTNNIYALGGGDGTMSATAFDTAVATFITRFSDTSDPLQEIAKYPFTDFYDSGFITATKKALASFISVRPDTFLTLGTHDVIAGTVLTATQESSLAAALLAAVQTYPESTTFGTPATRCIIVGRSGTLIGSTYETRVPCTFEIAIKAAKYMGASSGIWNTTYSFDSGANAILTYMTSLNVTFVPDTQKNTDWTNGLVGVEAFDRVRYYFPALKTVYSNDTSILTSYFNSRICANVEKVLNNARISVSGSDTLTSGQLVKRLNDFVNTAVANKYDNRVTIISDAYLTSDDTSRGYSYHQTANVYGDNMVTVGTVEIDTYRISALTTTTATTV